MTPSGTLTREPVAARAIGSSALRKEDEPLLRGSARFVDDLHDRTTLHAAILRSTYPHARIRSIDVTAARAAPGVADVVTAGDLPDGGPPIPMRMFRRPGMERFLQRPLAHDRVRYSGEPVAVVVADSRYRAEDALELIEVDYEPLPPVVDPIAAQAPDAPVLHEHAGSNLAAQFEIDHGDWEAAFEGAATVVEASIRCGRHGAVPMETRGLLAALEPGGERLVLQGAAKIVHVNRRILARLLQWPEERIRFVEPNVGGGFGARGEFYPEDYLIPWCAIRLGLPVAWTEDREEHLRSTNHSRDHHDRIAIALDEDARFLALRAEITMDTGAYIRTHGSVVPGMSAGLMPGPYAWPAYRCVVRQVVTNKTPSGTYRAPGRYEATLARERAIDIAAREVGVDPVELRRRNLVRPEQMPWNNGSHTDGHPVVYDSGDYPLLLQRGLERFDLPGARRWAAAAPSGTRRGVGVAFFVEKSGIAAWEYARVALQDGGRAVVFSGSASLGQGVETVLAQVCADTLGVPYEAVTVRHGDTDEVPDGMGSFGSRATSLGGAAVAEAASALRTSILDAAADHLEVAAADLELQAGRIEVRGSPGRGIELAKLLDELRPAAAHAAPVRPPFGEEAYFTTDAMSFPYGVHLAAVEVDVDTGAVRVERYAVAYDVGRAINPKLVEGQIVGGLAQGLGGALLEDFTYDADGQLVAGSFMDYLIPTASEVPRVDVLVTEDAPTPRTPLGAKGAGEGGTAAAGAAIAAAVSDALGVEVTSLPILPEWVHDAAKRSA